MVGPGRFMAEMGSRVEKNNFFFYGPYFKNPSFSRYSIVLFSHVPVHELPRLVQRGSLCELASLHSASLAIKRVMAMTYRYILKVLTFVTC